MMIALLCAAGAMSDYNGNHESASAFDQRSPASAAAGGQQFDFSAEPEIVQHPSDSETYDRHPHVSLYKADEEGQVCVRHFVGRLC
jgi:hypothetical protein